MILEGIARIAVLRAAALGDFIFVLPALDALRAAYPEAEIVYLGREWHRGFMTGRPGPIDRVIALPSIVGDEADLIEDPSIRESFLLDLRAERFDLALQLHGGGRNSNPFLLGIGARHTAGLRTPDAALLDTWVPYIYYQPEVLRYLEVVALVGAPPVGLEPRLSVTDADRAEAAQILDEDSRRLDGRPLAVLHPGATARRRRWPGSAFAAVGDALAGAGARVAVIGVAEEREIVRTVVGSMKGEALDLSGRLSLGGLAGLLARSVVLVGNDSGPLHLANAVGARTVGIFWVGNLINGGPFTRTRHRPQISWQLVCSVCGVDNSRARCDHDPSFVDSVPVEEVRSAALELLAAADTPDRAPR